MHGRVCLPYCCSKQCLNLLLLGKDCILHAWQAGSFHAIV